MTSPNRRLLGWLVLAASFLKGTPLYAQEMELGGTVGLATAGIPDESQLVTGWGIEACAQCSGRFGFFAEYSHWSPAIRPASYGIARVNLVGGGLRIQEPLPGGRRGLFFLDLGLGLGRWRLLEQRREHDDRDYGFILGYGAMIPVLGGWYLRPQVRLYLMGGCCPVSFASYGGGVGAGIRF
jgi:hypothetical protein